MLVVLVASSLVLAGCSTATPYGPALDGKGYSELQTESDRFRVSFSGNSLTPRETVETYLLYRAAEITLQRGYDHFRMVDQDLESTTNYYNTFDAAPGYYGFYGRRSLRHRHGFGGLSYSYSTVTSRPVTSYQAIANIIVFSENKPVRTMPENDDRTYNARDVIKRLEPLIVRPEPEAD
ncbi:CC0125/CC1285 family lipoprotein [Denitrobaculum tricleocarpae]|uniref:DUF4136 domain-containing protein n=1 Tax=Denitrobaculum tricleocarpae TaxID=2591009 RepID=A0A545TGD5_9PROT|nr:hypothetical protein [Denitrobaculum tricleocarpae]TQV76304.1 hypothetical protein FKG95_21990 [Denitrobaculum tricleocarpae]